MKLSLTKHFSSKKTAKDTKSKAAVLEVEENVRSLINGFLQVHSCETGDKDVQFPGRSNSDSHIVRMSELQELKVFFKLESSVEIQKLFGQYSEALIETLKSENKESHNGNILQEELLKTLKTWQQIKSVTNDLSDR